MEAPSAALEQFRQEWRNEVSARSKQQAIKPEEIQPQSQPQPSRRRDSTSKPERPQNKPPTRHPLADVKDDDYASDSDHAESSKSRMIERIEGLRVRDTDEDDFGGASSKEPNSALEHYEKAVEKESQGSLGDSLSHYRKAYRLDAKVDQSYRAKHFPAKSKPVNPNPSNAPVTVPSTAHHSSKEPEEPGEQRVLTTSELISSFADAPILAIEPIIPGDRPPPCPMQKLPTEVLLELLQHVAVRDPAILARVSRVCKRMAYHVCTENTIWRRVALGHEFGLASQRYSFSTDVQGRQAIFRALEDDEDLDHVSPPDESTFGPDANWREVFHSHPRIRFTGVYISTVNYIRAGGASATAFTWNSAVHIVTYYRYLRFFRDGTCISLLTTNEPIEVVHHLTAENLNLVRDSGRHANHPLIHLSSASAPLSKDGTAPPPSAQNIMKHALRGRWRLCHPSLTDTGAVASTGNQPDFLAGDIHIETEGAGPRYLYTMHLSLKSSGRSKTAVKNNKLQWKGFWSYNCLTNDWAEFQLKNDKAFYFSRVKSYGLGY